MPHAITAIVLKGSYNENKLMEFDLKPIPLTQGLTLFHIDTYYAVCWQYKLQTNRLLQTFNVDSMRFPTEIAIAEIMKKVTEIENPKYAIITTDYFGGVGTQYANVYIGEQNASEEVKTINQALQFLDVIAKDSLDEFDTVGLGNIRHQPDYLEKYVDLADEYGV